MTFNERVDELARLIGTDIGSLLSRTGELSTLNTIDKRSLVAAINELHDSVTNNVSLDPNNIIQKKIDGLYAEINAPFDISSFTNALDNSLQQ